MEAVARARSLPVTGEVEVAVKRRSEIRDSPGTRCTSTTPASRSGCSPASRPAWASSRSAPNGEQILLDMLEIGVMGLYEPKQKTLLIGTHVGESMLDMVVGHEIAHGLQDMHFDLKRLQKPIRGDSDAESARTYLVEGDAQAAYLAWVSGERGLNSIDDAVFLATGNQALDLADLAPYPVLARSLQLPYADGAATVARLVRERGWSAVDALYKRPPDHHRADAPPRQAARPRGPARRVTVDPGALTPQLPGHRVVWQDNLGEAALLAMLADVEPAPVARAAAAGWGGDRYLALDTQPPGVAPLIVGSSPSTATPTPPSSSPCSPPTSRSSPRRLPPRAPSSPRPVRHPGPRPRHPPPSATPGPPSPPATPVAARRPGPQVRLTCPSPAPRTPPTCPFRQLPRRSAPAYRPVRPVRRSAPAADLPLPPAS
jgi:hypothetical protein